MLQQVWHELEKLVVSGYINNIGVTDFDYESLKELCENSKVSSYIQDVMLLSTRPYEYFWVIYFFERVIVHSLHKLVILIAFNII